MAINLPTEKPLNVAELGALAARAESIVNRMREAKRVYDKHVEAMKSAIAARYKTLEGVSIQEKQRVAEAETSAQVGERRRELLAVLDPAMRELGAVHESYQRELKNWPGPLQILDRMTLADPKRQLYQANLAGAGATAVYNAAIQALMNGDAALTAAIVWRLDQMPRRDRPFPAAALAERISFEPWEQAAAALNAIDQHFRAGVTLYRTLKQVGYAPVGRVQNAMARGPFRLNDDGSIEVS